MNEGLTNLSIVAFAFEPRDLYAGAASGGVFARVD
jgi:hypothetical protein